MSQLIRNLKDWYNTHLFGWIAFRYLSGCKTILELGCYSNSILNKSGIPKKAFVTGVDIFTPYLSVNKEHYHRCYGADVTEARLPGYYDAVVCMELLEHLEKDKGLELLERMKKYALRVIVTTPNGCTNNIVTDDNVYNKHRSSWTVLDFKLHNYKVRGLSGWKMLRTDMAELRFKRPYLLWAVLSVMTIPIFYFLPRYSYHLLATYQ